MNSFRDKNFKNALDPNFTSYDCIRSCEIQRSTEKSFENFWISCKWSPPTKDSLNEKRIRKAWKKKRRESYIKH